MEGPRRGLVDGGRDDQASRRADDEKTILGSRITDLGTSFFEIDKETQIPYHRVLRVEVGATLVYERRPSTPSSKKP